MSLRQIQFRREYRSFQNDIVNEFYIPALKEAVLYQRAVGFFSSSSLNLIASGIKNICENKGKIQIIASPKLSQEDVDEISKGYREREIIERALIRELNNPTTEKERENLSLISQLIAENYLDIKIAVVKAKDQLAMYDEKVGIITDKDGNKIAFSGSMNESENAFYNNYESFDVFCSWTSDSDRVIDKEMSFKSIWDDYEPGIKTIPFPNAVREKILQYRFSPKLPKEKETVMLEEQKNKNFHIPENFKIRDYQQKAIQNWENNNFTGIYDMATGTGKTLTALASAEYLYRKNNNRLGIIVVVPYQHLVTQWEEDIIRFGLKPIEGFSSSKQKNWKKRLQDTINAFNFKIKDTFCFVTTNATFCTEFVKTQISELEEDVLIIADEAHNLGATNTQNYLPEKIKYRLALSATIDRHRDLIGTNILYNYFGKKCITYSLKNAIDNDMLTKYYYYPIVVTLNEEELDGYREITQQIVKSLKEKNGKLIQTELTKTLLIKRSRIVAVAEDKIRKLRTQIEPYRDKNHILVYCGTGKLNGDNYLDELDCTEKSQIDVVCGVLGIELGMRVGRFTSKESASERETIKEKFDDGEMLQALVAIKCLDEGVNIPSISTAFILASSTNPKEYIQRRGRVLRKFPGKRYAEIYDFITLPCDVENINRLSTSVLNSTKGLVKNEIVRMLDFYEISENPALANELILNLKQKFNISEKDLREEEYAI